MLLVASYYDLRQGELPSWLNYLAIISSILYTVAAIITCPFFALYAPVAFLLPYLLWRINLVGGADAKLLTLACLVISQDDPSPGLPFLFVSLSYVLSFVWPNPRLLLTTAPVLALAITVALALAPGSLPYLLLVLLFSIRAVELGALGYSKSIPLGKLRPCHMVREAILGGEIVEVSDLDMFLRRRRFDYIPPLLLDEAEVERIRRTWGDKGRGEIKVARERPSVPAILLAYLLYPFLF
jgi:hypothetical protein